MERPPHDHPRIWRNIVKLLGRTEEKVQVALSKLVEVSVPDFLQSRLLIVPTSEAMPIELAARPIEYLHRALPTRCVLEQVGERIRELGS